MQIVLELYELKNLCRDMAELGAAKFAATQAPAKDLISQRDAYREFGEARIKGWVFKQLVSPTRTGTAKNSPIKFSRADLMACNEAEKLNCIINK